MSLDGKTLKVCSCNRTVALDAKALARGAEGERAAGRPRRSSAARDVGAFQAALGAAEDVIVACTQEAALFGELAAESKAKIRFVNVREQAGWSRARRRGDAEDRGAGRDGGAARAGAGAGGRIQVRGPAPDHRPGRRRRSTGPQRLSSVSST